MKNFCIFADALNYIEDNLTNELTQEDIAAVCCCSLSSLQKIWRYCSHTSIKEYISKRRLCIAAKEILAGELTITDIAYKYQYNSPEVFCRAFAKLWGVVPSKFAENWRSTAIFPRMIPDENNVGDDRMSKKVDISELYDELIAKTNTYVLCFDVVGLMKINAELGRKAGDKAILESLRRIDSAAQEDMAVFRIGGDEFAMVTGLSDEADLQPIIERVVTQNGNTVQCDGKDIPVSLRTAAVRYSGSSIRYSSLFTSMHDAINDARSTL